MVRPGSKAETTKLRHVSETKLSLLFIFSVARRRSLDLPPAPLAVDMPVQNRIDNEVNNVCRVKSPHQYVLGPGERLVLRNPLYSNVDKKLGRLCTNTIRVRREWDSPVVKKKEFKKIRWHQITLDKSYYVMSNCLMYS